MCSRVGTGVIAEAERQHPPRTMPGCADPERELRTLDDEFSIVLETIVAIAETEPLAPPTANGRMCAALDWFWCALEEAEAAGVDLDTLPRVIDATFRDALAKAEAAPGDPVVLGESAGDIGWAAGRVEDFVRFARFGAEEEARRRDRAEVVRKQARKLQRRSGGSYIQARRNVLAVVLASPIGLQRNRRTGARPRGRRPRTSRTSRGSPGRSTDDPDLDQVQAFVGSAAGFMPSKPTRGGRR